MREFDPRHDAPRAFALTPKLAAGAVAVVALAFGWKLALAGGRADPPPQDPKVLAALEHEAFAGAEAQPGFTRPENVPVKVLPGETLEAAVQRAGVAPDDARQAVTTLAQAMDIVHIKAGMAFDAAVAHPRSARGPARLIGLSLRTGPATAVTLSRTFDGALRLREMEEKVREEETVATGAIDGSLYESAARLGAHLRRRPAPARDGRKGSRGRDGGDRRHRRLAL